VQQDYTDILTKAINGQLRCGFLY